MSNRRAQRTRQEVAALRAFSRRRRRRLPRQIYPRGIQLAYSRQLLAIVREAREALAPLLDELPTLAQTAAEDQRLDAGEGRRVSEIIAAARAGLSISRQRLERLAQLFAERTATWQRRQLGKQLEAALGVEVIASDAAVGAAVEGFVAENVALIRDLPDKMYGDIERLLHREIPKGTLHKDLAKMVQERFGIAERRAKLIARDQVGKFYGNVQKVRQEALGVERFIWRTANDERVRDEHADREGVTYTWANAPEGGPGAPINCRCYAEPVLDDLLPD